MKSLKILFAILFMTALGQVQAHRIKREPIYILNGKVISKDEMNKINPNTIESINVLKGEKAIAKYGKKGKKGVVEITSKQ
jgi:hypothetical protein